MHLTPRALRRTGLGLIIAGILAASLSGLTSAGASVSPTTVYTTNGEAGYYAFGGNGFSAGHSQVYIRKYAANLPNGGALGIQGCNNNVNYAVQVGLVPNPSSSPRTFSVHYAQGSFTSTTADPCVGNGTLSPSSPIATTALQNIPINENIAFNFRNLGHHLVVVSAQDLTTDTTYWSKVLSVPVNYWTEVGVGLQGTVSGLAGPATNELTAMRDTSATSNSGVTAGLGLIPGTTAVQVDSSATGFPPALITDNNSLTGGVFKIYAATPIS